MTTINVKDILLASHWPALPDNGHEAAIAMEAMRLRRGWWNLLGCTWHNVEAPFVARGTTVKLGSALFIYLMFGEQSAAEDKWVKTKSLCVPQLDAGDYCVTNDPDKADHLPCMRGVYALSAMCNWRFGWFWCGGMAPDKHVPAMAGEYKTVESPPRAGKR